MNEAIMSGAGFSDLAKADGREGKRASPTQVGLIWTLTLASLYAAIPSIFADPFIRHDDYAALLGRADVYIGSTLAEGRWLNYWWALRPVFFDHQAIFALYHALWALTAALLAGALFPPSRAPWRMALAALVFVFAPPMMNTSLWPGTLIPGVALVAGYAGVVAFGSIRARVWALPLLATPALMSHGSFPLLMLVMALVAPGWRGPRGQIACVALFGASLVLGTLLIFSLNWTAYGVFGVRIDEWRGATPARDLAGALDMLTAYVELLRDDLESMMHLPPPIVAAGLVASLVLLLAVDRAAAARVLLALAVILGVQAAQGVVTGLLTPFRGQFPLWVAIAAIPLLGLGVTRTIGRSAFFVLAALALLTIGAHHWRLFEAYFAPYQVATRALSEAAQTVDPSGVGALYVVGDPREIPGGDRTQSSLALRYRLEMLTDRKVVMCVREPVVCAPLDAHSGPPVYPEPGFMRTLPGGDLLIRLPDTPDGKIEDPTQWQG